MASTGTRNLGRISEIAQVAVRHGFGYFFETHRLTDLLPGRPKLDEAMPYLARAYAVHPRWADLVPRLPATGLLPNDSALVGRIVSGMKKTGKR